MSDQVILAIGLVLGTLSLRLIGYFVGAKLPATGFWARAFVALPGCLIVSLLTVFLMDASLVEWSAASFALCAAVFTRSVPVAMLVGIGAVWVFRNIS
ncbi:MAG: AzlD domain-containing protein [Pseudomonadota bacterium]